MSKQLSTIEETRRNQCEREIREARTAGLNAALAIGRALRTIRDEKLYRTTHTDFDDYCAEVWEYGKSHSYRLIDHAEVVELAQKAKVPHGGLLTERTTRPIAALPEPKRIEAIAEAKRLAGEKSEPIAAKHFRAAAKMVAPPKAPRPRLLPPLVPEFADPVYQQAAVEASTPTIDPAAATDARTPQFQAQPANADTLNSLHGEFMDLARRTRAFCGAHEREFVGHPQYGPLMTRLIGVSRNVEMQLTNLKLTETGS